MAQGSDDNFIRSLQRLYDSRQTSRVFNVARLHADLAAAGQPVENPLFANRYLNKAIISKHRLRRGEDQMFVDRRFAATKIMILIDVNNLRVGAKYVMVDQRNWLGILGSEAFIDPEKDAQDLRILTLLDRAPSFDPFMLREWFARDGLVADPRYFEVPPQLINAMETFVLREVSRLVAMAFGGDAQTGVVTSLVRKMLASQYDDDLDPLRQSLKLSKDEFAESMFAWKGFLYYKWQMSLMSGQIASLADEIGEMVPIRGITPRLLGQMRGLSDGLRPAIAEADAEANALLAQYDAAYKAITLRADPAAFRQFLFEAPVHFMKLGHVLGVLVHMCQYWRFRAGPPRSGIRIPAQDLLEILEAFTGELNLEDQMQFA